MPNGKRAGKTRRPMQLTAHTSKQYPPEPVDYDDPSMPHADDMQPLIAHRTVLGAIPNLEATQMRFLLAYSVSGNVTQACKAASIERSMHYRWSSDANYMDAFHEAQKLSDEYLERIAFDLASGRIEKPVVSAGKLVTYEKVYDSKLLLRLLASRRPDKYGTKIDVTSGGQSLVKLVDREAWDSV